MSSTALPIPASWSVFKRIALALSGLLARSAARREQRRLADAAVVMGV